MIDANKKVFSILDDYCSIRQDPVKNASCVRYISGPTTDEKKFLTDAKVILTLEFTAIRRVILYEHDGRNFFCLVGFENSEAFSTIREENINGGYFTAIISDLKPKPIATTTAIRNIVEAQDKSIGTSYIGHNVEIISTLFPKVKIFSNDLVSTEEAYRIFFRYCIVECSYDDYWLNDELVGCLISLCDMDSSKIPYQTLCRSIFDADPAALYLSLYRCIEALYSLKTVERLSKELKVVRDWNEISIILEKQLGWRAPESSSLNELLLHVKDDIFIKILESLGVEKIGQIFNLSNSTGKQIYKLRNALVHFRPIHHRTEYDKINWNCLCSGMASLVKNIYEGISFPSLEAQ